MYFHCLDGKVIDEDVQMTNAYRERKDAEATLGFDDTNKMWHDKTKPVPKKTVEGFYLVHESLFEK